MTASRVVASDDRPLSSAPSVEHPSSIIASLDAAERGRALERRSFAFRHSLGHHSSMDLPRIRTLAKRMLDERRFDQVYYFTRESTDSGHNSTPESVDHVIDTLDSLDTAGAWLRLTRVDEVTDQFRDVVESFYDDLTALYGEDIRSRVMKTFVTLFISSPGAVTSYHMDHTWNFLLQISGQKTVHLFDPNDTRVLRPQDKEGWYMQQSWITRKDGIEGIAYDLGAGDGVHHPVNAPHWVQNGNDVSISLSLGLCLHASNRDAKIHQVNYVLRKVGLDPVPPGTSAWRDRAKASTVSLLSDRNPTSFDAVVFSGMNRAKRILKAAGAKRLAGMVRRPSNE